MPAHHHSGVPEHHGSVTEHHIGVTEHRSGVTIITSIGSSITTMVIRNIICTNTI